MPFTSPVTVGHLQCSLRVEHPSLQWLQQWTVLNHTKPVQLLFKTREGSEGCGALTGRHAEYQGPVSQCGLVRVFEKQITPSSSTSWVRPAVPKWSVYYTTIHTHRTGGCHNANPPSLKEVNGKWKNAMLNSSAIHWAAAEGIAVLCHTAGKIHQPRLKKKKDSATYPFLSTYAVCKLNSTEDITTMLMKP